MPDEPDNKSDIKSDSSKPSESIPKKSFVPKPKPDDQPEVAVKKIGGKKSKFEDTQEMPEEGVKLKSTKKDAPATSAEPAAKAKAKAKPKHEALPQIPDYDRPDLEIYDPSDFDPTKKEKSDSDDQGRTSVKSDDSVPEKKTLPRPKGKTAPEESAEATIKDPKSKPKGITKESADANVSNKTLKPAPTVEENAKKNIVIKGTEEMEIKVADEDELAKKSVSFDKDTNDEPSAKKKVLRKKYDPLVYIPDPLYEEDPSDPNLDPQNQSSYPDNNDLNSEKNLDANDIEVNMSTHTVTYTKLEFLGF